MNAPSALEPWNNPDAKPLIRFDGVTKRFGSFTAIDGIDLNIFEGEFFALLGPSGCGKTTLMRILAGFENPTEGSILLDGRDLAGTPPNRRSTNMMFQSYALFPHLSVFDNIAFGLRRDRLAADRIKARTEEMIALVQLQKFANRKPHQISGGQRQRVALARALAKAPKLLLLDEPLGALDKKLRRETQFELMDIQERTGTTFVIVTHDQEEAMTVATRVAVMDHGRIAQIATPTEIYEAPNSTYVADFIGDVNILEGRAVSGNGMVSIDWAENQPSLRCKSALRLLNGTTAFVAIRPEKVSISSIRPEASSNVIPGKVLDIAYLGNVSTYHVEIPGGQVIKAQTANTDRITRRDFTWEEDVWLHWSDTAGIVLER